MCHDLINALAWAAREEYGHLLFQRIAGGLAAYQLVATIELAGACHGKVETSGIYGIVAKALAGGGLLFVLFTGR